MAENSKVEFGKFLHTFLEEILKDVPKVPDIPNEDLNDLQFKALHGLQFKALQNAAIRIKDLETILARETAYIQQLTKAVIDERGLYEMALKDIQIRDDQIEVLETRIEELEEENSDLRSSLTGDEDDCQVFYISDNGLSEEQLHEAIEKLRARGNDVDLVETEEGPETSVFADFYNRKDDSDTHNTELLLTKIQNLEKRLTNQEAMLERLTYSLGR